MLSIRRIHLAVLLAAGLLVTSATSRAVDPRLLPANTEIVFTFNIKQILDSELVKSKDEALKQVKAAVENLPNSDEVMKYFKQMSFDPFTHLTSITVAHPGSQDPKEVFIVIDGTFHAKKFAETAATAAQNYPGTIRVTKFGGTPVYEVQGPGDTAYIALVGGKSLVITIQEEALKAAITRSTGDTVAASKVKELLKTTSDKQSLSFVITGDAMMRMAQKAKGAAPIPGVGDAMASITGLTGAITIVKDINFQFGVGTKDEKSAKEIVAAGNVGLLLLNGLVTQKAKAEPEFAPLLDVMRTLRISSVATNAVLTGSVSQDNLEKLVKALGKQFQGGF